MTPLYLQATSCSLACKMTLAEKGIFISVSSLERRDNVQEKLKESWYTDYHLLSLKESDSNMKELQ